MTGDNQEFLYGVIIYGGIIFAGLLVVTVLGFFAIALKGKLKKKTIIKDLYEQKERKNGQHKGGSHGSY